MQAGNILNVIVIVANVVSVYLAARNIRATWLFTFVASVILAFLFFSDGLYMSFAFNSYCAIMSIVGIIRWKRTTQENDETITWSRSAMPHACFVALAVLLITCNTEVSQSPVVDALCTAMSVVATWLLVKKDIWTWFYWVTSDIIYIVFGMQSHDWKYFAIYGTVMLLDMYGGYLFIKKYRQREVTLH